MNRILLKRGSVAEVILLIAISLVGLSSVLTAQPAGRGKTSRLSLGLDVTGTLVGELDLDASRGRARLPAAGVVVRLVDARDRIAEESATESSGYFRFAHHMPGSYRVCWESRPWGKGCTEPFDLAKRSHSLQVIHLDPAQFRRRSLLDELEPIIGLLGIEKRCEVNGVPRFLYKRRNSSDFDPDRERTIGDNYYRAIDPFNERLTLGDWWAKNGFDGVTGAAPAESNGFNAGHISYLNDNDLGFGRDMHCLKRNGNVACWVSNHGQADQNPANADLAAAAQSPGATVVMEYRAPPASYTKVSPKLESRLTQFNSDLLGGVDLDRFLKELARIVTFYVYAPSSGDQAHAEFGRVVSADLDGCGEKFVPGLCFNCHGGTVSQAIFGGERDDWNSDDLLEAGSASFREFDHPTYKLPGGRTAVNVVEEAMFYTLNQLVLDTHPASGIEELVEGWYSGGPVLDPGYVPDAWQGAPAIYTDIVGRYCRTCHVAFEEYRNWNAEEELYSLTQYLCDERSMPHAAVTYFNMSDDDRKALLTHYGEDLCN